jgi:WD40 repeat protein
MVPKRLAVALVIAVSVLISPRTQAREIYQNLSFAAARTTLNLPVVDERRFYPSGSPAQVGFEFLLSPGRVAADISGKAVLDDATGLVRVEGERGRLDVTFGLRAGTRFKLTTGTPFGEINIDEPIPFAPNIDFAIDQGTEFSSLPLPGAPDQPVEVLVLKSFSEDLISVNLVDYLIAAFTGLPNVGTIAGVHGDLGINLSDTLLASLSGDHVSIGPAKITAHGTAVPAPDFDRAAAQYVASVAYEERLQFEYSWDFTGYVGAALEPLGIEIWEKRWDLVHTSIPIIPNPLLPDLAPTVDLPFQAVDVVFPLGVGLPPVASIDRPRVEFGTVAAESPRPEQVRISNTGSAAFRITGISPGLTSGPFAISGLSPGTTVPAGDSITFTVTFRPTMSGLSSASFSLNTDIPGADPLPLNVSGLAGVTREQLTISVDPSTVPIDDVSTATVTARITDASGSPKRNVTVRFGQTGGGIAPVFDNTDANGIARTMYSPSEPGPQQVTAETSLSGPVSAAVTNVTVENAYSIVLNKALLQPGNSCVWEILARLTWRESGAEVENGTVTFTTDRGLFTNGSTSIGLPIMDGEPAGVARLEISSDTPATVTASLESSSAQIVVEGRCPLLELDALRTELVGQGYDWSEPEVDWSHDGRLLVAKEDNLVHIYDTSSWVEVHTINPKVRGAAQSVSFSPDGELLAVATSNGGLLVYGNPGPPYPADWPVVVDMEVRHQYSAIHNSLAWSEDSRHIALVSDDALVRVHDARSGATVRDYAVDTSRGPAMTVAWESDLLAIGTEHGNVEIWNPNTASRVTASTEIEIYGMRWSDDGSSLAVVGDGGRRDTLNAVILDRAGSETSQILIGPNPNTPNTSVDWSPDDARLVISNEEYGSVVVDRSGTPIYRLLGTPARAVAWYPGLWHPDNPDVIAVTLDLRVHLYSTGEFISPTMRIAAPSEAQAVEDAFTITWEDWDPDSNARISLSAQAASGPPISIVKGLSEDDDGSEDSYEWSLSASPGIQPGVAYHIVAEINDGLHDPVSVTSPGTVTMDDPPSASVISPPRGPAGTEVTIIGEGFRAGATVMFDSTEVTASSVADTRVVALVPAGVAGSIPVVVQNPGGLITETSLVFEVGAPVRIQRVPGTLSAGNAITITVTGPPGMTVTADVSALDTTRTTVPLHEGPSGTYRATLVVSEDSRAPAGIHSIPIFAVDAGVQHTAATTVELIGDGPPDLTLSLGEATTDPGGEAQLEVRLTDADGLAAFDFDVQFNTALLEFVSVTPSTDLLDRWVVEGRATDTGASIGGFALDAVADPSHAGGTLTYIALRATEAAQDGTSAPVVWGDKTQLYDALNGPVEAAPADGLVHFGNSNGPMLGDVNCDGSVTALDARMCLQVAVGLQPDGLCDDWFVRCDVNLDGRITALDARMILQNAVGLIELPAASPVAGVPDGAPPTTLWWEVDRSDGGITAYLVGRGVEAADLTLLLPETPLLIRDSDGMIAQNLQDGLLRVAWINTDSGPRPKRLIAVSAQPGHHGPRSITGARLVALAGVAYGADGGEVAASLPYLPVESLVQPETTQLLANYPNPFNPETWIPFQLAAAGTVRVDIYDQNGQALRRMDLGTLSSGSYLSQGRAARWDGRNDRGEPVASGTYYVVLRTNGQTQTRRVIVHK